MHVVMLERSTGAEICRAAVFEDDASATDTSLASVGGGVVVANTHGYASPLRTLLGRGTSGGVARVDVPADRSGGECRVRWTSDVVAPSSVPRVSLATGLVYAYTKRPDVVGRQRVVPHRHRRAHRPGDVQRAHRHRAC